MSFLYIKVKRRTSCSVWKSYFFAFYGSRTFLLCIEVVLFCFVWKSFFFALYGSRTLFTLYWSRTFFTLYWSRTFLLCMEVVLFCSLWKSYFFVLYGSRTFLLSMEVVLFCSVWRSYFFALYGSRAFLLCIEGALFCSLNLYESRTFLLSMEVVLFCSLWKSYFFALYGSRTSIQCTKVWLPHKEKVRLPLIKKCMTGKLRPSCAFIPPITVTRCGRVSPVVRHPLVLRQEPGSRQITEFYFSFSFLSFFLKVLINALCLRQKPRSICNMKFREALKLYKKDRD